MPHIGCGADVLRWRREKAEERKRLEDLGIIPRTEEFKPAKNSKYPFQTAARDPQVFNSKPKYRQLSQEIIATNEKNTEKTRKTSAPAYPGSAMGSVMASFAFAPASIITLGISNKQNQPDPAVYSCAISPHSFTGPFYSSSDIHSSESESSSVETVRESASFKKDPDTVENESTLISDKLNIVETIQQSAVSSNTGTDDALIPQNTCKKLTKLNSDSLISTIYERQKGIQQSSSCSALKIPLAKLDNILSPVLQKNTRKERKKKLLHQSSDVGRKSFECKELSRKTRTEESHNTLLHDNLEKSQQVQKNVGTAIRRKQLKRSNAICESSTNSINPFSLKVGKSDDPSDFRANHENGRLLRSRSVGESPLLSRLCTECRMTAGSTVPNLSSRTDQQTLSTHQLNTSFKGKYERKDSCEETNIDQLAKDLVSTIDKESYCQEVSDSLNEESEETVNIIQESYCQEVSDSLNEESEETMNIIQESYCQEVSDSLNEESEETVNIIQESVEVSWFQLQLIRTSRAKRTDYQQLRRSVHQDDGDLCSLLFEDPSLYSDSDLKDRIYLELL